VKGNRRDSTGRSDPGAGGAGQNEPTDTTMTGTRRPRTPEEQRLIDDLGSLFGKPLTVQEVNLAIDQARWLGDL
jgi:hypothetical protein